MKKKEETFFCPCELDVRMYFQLSQAVFMQCLLLYVNWPKLVKSLSKDYVKMSQGLLVEEAIIKLHGKSIP
jgi:hypothetical protein